MTASLQIRNRTVSAQTPALIVPVIDRSATAVLDSMRQAVVAGADLVEWRADYWLHEQEVHAGPSQVGDLLKEMRQILGHIPLLFTIRTQDEGGMVAADSSYTAGITQAAISGCVDLIDIEFRRECAQQLMGVLDECGVPAICSFHNFSTTPSVSEMIAILDEQEHMGAAIAKLAVMPHTVEDVAALLLVTSRKSRNANIPIITISMGEQGAISRIVGHTFGSAATFASMSQESAPGQISIASLRPLLKSVNGAT